MMNENQKVKILAGALVIFLLGMGSSWFVLRSPGPQTGSVADTPPKMKKSRLVLADKADKPKRSRRTAGRDNRNERSKRVREGYPQKSRAKKKRDFTRKTEKTKINPKAKGF